MFGALTTKSQVLPLKIEKIEVRYLPWAAKTPMNFTEEKLLDYQNKSINSKTLTDSVSLDNFSKIKFVRKDAELKINTLDVRMLIMVYFSENNYLTISLNSFKSYKFLDTYYKPSLEFMDWINKNVTKCEMGYE